MSDAEKLLLIGIVSGFMLGWAACFFTLRVCAWTDRRKTPILTARPAGERIYFPGPDGATLSMDRATLEQAKAAANRDLRRLGNKS